jgi:hypothetical protein
MVWVCCVESLDAIEIGSGILETTSCGWMFALIVASAVAAGATLAYRAMYREHGDAVRSVPDGRP